MGEYADYCINQIHDSYWDLEDEFDGPLSSSIPISRDRDNKVCRCCGKNGLHWKQVDNKWLLHNDKGIHECEKNPYNLKCLNS